MNILPYTDDEWNTLPHIILTSDDKWDSTILDNSLYDDDDDNDDWYNIILDIFTNHNDII